MRGTNNAYMRVADPDLEPWIRDPGWAKNQDPGSGSATLHVCVISILVLVYDRITMTEHFWVLCRQFRLEFERKFHHTLGST